MNRTEETLCIGVKKLGEEAPKRPRITVLKTGFIPNKLAP
jgi:hypothetical protein